jgi:hypothetical protein
MENFFSDYWKILKLDVSIFEKIRNDKLGFNVSLRLFLVISLTISLGTLAAALAAGPKGIASRLENSVAQLEQLSTNVPPAFSNSVTTLQKQVEEISAALDKYQPPLGRDMSYTIRAFGQWLSTPLLFLSSWMVASLAVFIFAKILKGQGDLREHINLFLLGFAPQILLIVSSFSFFNTFLGLTGGILRIGALVWSLAVIIKGLNTVHGFATIKSLGVLILTFLFFGVLLPALSTLPFILGFVSIFSR